MITEYFRPSSLEDALALIERAELTLPLGGGTLLNAPHDVDFAVVDLQALALDGLAVQGRFLEVGAGARLQALAGSPDLPAGLGAVILQEATSNLLNQATVAGGLLAADGRSPLACALLALDARLHCEPGDETLACGQALLSRREAGPGLPYLPGRIVTHLTLQTGVRFAYDAVARSPADRPVITAAAAYWPSGRLRITIGGWGQAPRLVLDAPEPGGVEEAAASAASDAGDPWASAEYRREVSPILVQRVAAKVSAGG